MATTKGASRAPDHVTCKACVPVRRVSPAEGHYFFGYYEKSPWDASGRYLLAGHADFVDRQPTRDDELTVGMIDLQNGDRFIELDRTTAWSWQQGTMLQWLGPTFDRQVIYNRIVDGRPAAVIRDVFTGASRTLPMPIYVVSGDGRRAVSLDFGRLHRLRPGYGYASVDERFPDEPTPAEDGVFTFDLTDTAPQPRLLASLRELSQLQPRPDMVGQPQWVNHLQINPTGSRVAWLHRWPSEEHPRFRTRLCCATLDPAVDRDLRIVREAVTPLFSHYDWRDERTILAFAADEANRMGFRLYDVFTGRTEQVGAGVLPDVDGHCSYSPDRRWILNDTYPDAQHRITLMIYQPSQQRRIDLAHIYSMPQLRGPCRCDLHPRWSRRGDQICIDSTHEGHRGVYVLDVAGVIG